MTKKELIEIIDLISTHTEHEEYYYVDSYGVIEAEIDEDNKHDDFCFITGNYFLTEEDAEKYLEYITNVGKVNRRIEELNEGWKPDWNDTAQNKYEIYSKFGKIGCEIMILYRSILVIKHCKSLKVANQIISEMKPELDIIFNYE